MYMYAWKQGIKTTYYLRSRPATSIAKVTLSQATESAEAASSDPQVVNANASSEKKEYSDSEAIACSLENPEACEACQ